jgi:pepF/M3 family oligoendopeptidase
MLGAMRASFPAFRRYWHAKARRLGQERLPWWDLWAPVGRLERRYTFAEARDFILEQFGAYSERLAGFARRAFDHNWIDAEPRDGKRGGAFCMRLPAVEESRILCNFDGSLGQVATIAHELGHAYHNACMMGKTSLQRRTPMTLAETASIFCQTIIVDATLEQVTDDEEELAILEDFLIDASQVIVDIYSRYLFETEVFERRADAELSADDFCDVMRRCQQETYGDGLDSLYLHPYMWAWKPHYYSPSLSYYNFPYAFGLLFGLGLYAIYRQRGADFLPQYDALLSSTGEATAADLAARFDIDLRQPAFWEGSIRVIEARIERYLAL